MITPQMAKFEPTDRSIPPEMITMVIPRAMIPIAEQFLRMVMKLLHLKNPGARMLHTAIMIKQTNITL